MINGGLVNGFEVNGEGSSSLYYDLTLALSLKVVRQYSLALPLSLKTTRAFSLALPLSLVVTNHASYGSPQTRWQPRVLLDGADITARVHGQIGMDAEEGAARLVRFNYFPLGAFNPSALVGKSVVVEYAHFVSGVLQAWVRMFTGQVDIPELDVTTGMVGIAATDNRQNQLAAATREQIDALTPGALWSPWVFDENQQAIEYLDARLSTLAASLDKSPDGQFRLTPWAAKSVADYSFDLDEHMYGTPTLDIARRDRLVNTVNISFDYRFPRLRARQIGYSWDYRRTTANGAASSGTPVGLPSSGMIKAAALDTGWEMTFYQDNIKTVPARTYSYAEIIAENDPAVEYFYMNLAKRWGQRVTEKYALEVTASNSVSALGTLADTEVAAGEVDFDVSAWENDPAYPPVLTVSTIGDVHQDVVGQAADGRAVADLAMQVLVARAMTAIKSSHRATRVTFSAPLNPLLDLTHTVSLNAQHLVAKGKVSQIVQTLDIETGAATMDVTLAISGLATVGLPSDPANTPPDPPAAPASLETVFEKVLMSNIGIPPDYDLEGYTPQLLSVLGIESQFRINTPEIDDAERQPADMPTINQAYDMIVPVDTLTWS